MVLFSWIGYVIVFVWRVLCGRLFFFNKKTWSCTIKILKNWNQSNNNQILTEFFSICKYFNVFFWRLYLWCVWSVSGGLKTEVPLFQTYTYIEKDVDIAKSIYLLKCVCFKSLSRLLWITINEYSINRKKDTYLYGERERCANFT